jgi:hypothetical protein
MVDMPPFLRRGWGGTHGRDAGQDREQARSHRRLFGHVHPTGRASDRAPLTRPTSQINDTNGLADQRVRPSERNPARFLDDRPNGHRNHPCSSALPRSVQNAATEHRCPESRVHAPTALLAGDRDARSVGRGEEVVSGVLDWHRQEPHSADRWGPCVPGRWWTCPEGRRIPQHCRFWVRKLTSSTCGR